MIYEAGSLLSVNNLFAVIISHNREISKYKIWFPFHNIYDLVSQEYAKPIIAKYDLDKPFFANIKRSAELRHPELSIKWIQSEENK